MLFVNGLCQSKKWFIFIFGLLIVLFFGSLGEAVQSDGMINELYFDEAPLSITLRENFGETIGYLGNYQTLEGQLFLPTSVRNLWEFVDFRVHHFDDNTYGGNEGIGFRYLLERYHQVVGINLYYDFQTTRGHNTFNQLGIGFELLSPCWCFRLNGYIPVGDKVKKVGRRCVFDQYVGGFFATRQEYEATFSGMDLEAEHVIFESCCHRLWVSIAGGPYYYFPTVCCEKAIFGGRFCVMANFLNLIDIGLCVSNDNLFDTLVQAHIGVTIPFWWNLCGSPCECYCPFICEPVWRNETIVRDHFCRWKYNW